MWQFSASAVTAGRGLTFQNVTTAESQWDAQGRLLRGEGIATLVRDEQGTARPLETELETNTIPGLGQGDAGTLLSMGDFWIRAAQQVCMHLNLDLWPLMPI